jgi:micrococcal nuclease
LDFNRSLVEGQTVTLEKDVSETDAEGRLLRYVHVGGRMVNEELLRQGLARVEMVPPDLKYGARFQAVEQEAQAANLGIWSLE